MAGIHNDCSTRKINEFSTLFLILVLSCRLSWLISHKYRVVVYLLDLKNVVWISPGSWLGWVCRHPHSVLLLLMEMKLVHVYLSLYQSTLTHSAAGAWSELAVDWTLSSLATTSVQFRYVLLPCEHSHSCNMLSDLSKWIKVAHT